MSGSRFHALEWLLRWETRTNEQRALGETNVKRSCRWCKSMPAAATDNNPDRGPQQPPFKPRKAILCELKRLAVFSDIAGGAYMACGLRARGGAHIMFTTYVTKMIKVSIHCEVCASASLLGLLPRHPRHTNDKEMTRITRAVRIVSRMGSAQCPGTTCDSRLACVFNP